MDTSPTDTLAAASGAVAAGASIHLGGLALVTATSGSMSFVASVLVNLGLTTVAMGVRYVVYRLDIAPVVRHAYLVVCGALAMSTLFFDLAILVQTMK